MIVQDDRCNVTVFFEDESAGVIPSAGEWR